MNNLAHRSPPIMLALCSEARNSVLNATEKSKARVALLFKVWHAHRDMELVRTSKKKSGSSLCSEVPTTPNCTATKGKNQHLPLAQVPIFTT